MDATLLAGVRCAEAGPGVSPIARRRCVAGVLRDVADSLGNTPAVCRKSYIVPRVRGRFECSETIALALQPLVRPIELHDPSTLETIEAAVIAMLEDCPPLSIAA